VPMWTDRAPAAYRPLLETALAAAIAPAVHLAGDEAAAE